ncbi:MAG: polyprenyl synthetase family protein [Deltaproteobacteria bacterium]
MTFSPQRSRAGSAAEDSAEREIRLRRERVEQALLPVLFRGPREVPDRLREAMEYSLSAGGKRIRPVVLLLSGAAVGGDEEAMLPFACAVEYIHTYSLIHDDLPAMDDDDFRRGRPSCHKAFGEAEAILAGDALLTEAFRVMAESPLAARDPGRAVRAIGRLADASGAAGMAGGQMMDLSAEADPDPPSPERIARKKTAALLAAASAMGGILGGADDSRVEALSRYGTRLGILFQAVDDILDVTGSFEEMGKAVGKDRGRGKATFVAERGLAEAVRRSEELAGEAVAALSGFGPEADPLRRIVRIVSARRT